MLHVVIQNPPTRRPRGLLRAIQPLFDVVAPAVERLHRLLERRADDVDLRSARPFQQAERPRKRSHHQRFAVLARDEDKGLLDHALNGAALEEDQHAIDAELLPRLKQKRLAPQRFAVEALPLPMLERRLDDGDHEIRIGRVHVVLARSQHVAEAPTGHHDFTPGDFAPLQHVGHIRPDARGLSAGKPRQRRALPPGHPLRFLSAATSGSSCVLAAAAASSFFAPAGVRPSAER